MVQYHPFLGWFAWAIKELSGALGREAVKHSDNCHQKLRRDEPQFPGEIGPDIKRRIHAMDRFLDFQYAMAVEEFGYYMDNEFDDAMEANIGEAIKNISNAISKAVMFAIKKIIGILKAARDGVKKICGKIKGKLTKKDLKDGVGRPLGGIALPEKAGPSMDIEYSEGMFRNDLARAYTATSKFFMVKVHISTMRRYFNKAIEPDTISRDVERSAEAIAEDAIRVNDICNNVIDSCSKHDNDGEYVEEYGSEGKTPEALLKELDKNIDAWTKEAKNLDETWSWMDDDSRFKYHLDPSTSRDKNRGARINTMYHNMQWALSSAVKAASTVSSYINDNIIIKASHFSTD
jgi:hypothetical protein